MELLLEKLLQNWKLLKAVKRTVCTEEMNQTKTQNYIMTKSCPAEITNAQLYSTQFEVIFCEGLNSACEALEVCDDSEITIPAEISHTFLVKNFITILHLHQECALCLKIVISKFSINFNNGW